MVNLTGLPHLPAENAGAGQQPDESRDGRNDSGARELALRPGDLDDARRITLDRITLDRITLDRITLDRITLDRIVVDLGRTLVRRIFGDGSVIGHDWHLRLSLLMRTQLGGSTGRIGPP